MPIAAMPFPLSESGIWEIHVIRIDIVDRMVSGRFSHPDCGLDESFAPSPQFATIGLTGPAEALTAIRFSGAS